MVFDHYSDNIQLSFYNEIVIGICRSNHNPFTCLLFSSCHSKPTPNPLPACRPARRGGDFMAQSTMKLPMELGQSKSRFILLSALAESFSDGLFGIVFLLHLMAKPFFWENNCGNIKFPSLPCRPAGRGGLSLESLKLFKEMAFDLGYLINRLVKKVIYIIFLAFQKRAVYPEFEQ